MRSEIRAYYDRGVAYQKMTGYWHKGADDLKRAEELGYKPK